MRIVKTAPDAIKLLWQEKIFLKAKTQKEVEEELHKLGYNFGDATRKALESAAFLLREGGHGNKKFIQKYPFIEDGGHDIQRGPKKNK